MENGSMQAQSMGQNHRKKRNFGVEWSFAITSAVFKKKNHLKKNLKKIIARNKYFSLEFFSLHFLESGLVGYFLFFLFLTAKLFVYCDVTSVTENEPSSLVEGVSVITGDLCIHNPVYTVQGAEPIRLSNTYISEGWLFNGYEHYRATWNEGCIYIREPYGTNVYYMTHNQKWPGYIGEYFYGNPEKKKHWKSRLFTADHFLKTSFGIANTASGNLSAQTHIKNHKIIFDHEHDPEGKSFSFHVADGTVRYYVKAVRQTKATIPYSGVFKNKEYYANYNYLLLKEDLPNGHTLHYVRQGDELVEMKTTNRAGTKVFASVKLPPITTTEIYHGSDGQSAAVFSGYIKEAKRNLI